MNQTRIRFISLRTPDPSGDIGWGRWRTGLENRVVFFGGLGQLRGSLEMEKTRLDEVEGFWVFVACVSGT
jgi:hypothetical protein